MLRLLRTADGLLRRASVDAEGIRQRLVLVDQECENFMVRVDARRKNIFMAVSFFNLAETVSFPFYTSFINFFVWRILKNSDLDILPCSDQ